VLAAFKFWLLLGFISFGGPAGQIALMHTELVEKRRWISERRFLHALNYCMLLPGPEATQLAIYIGWLMHGVLGGIVAGVLFLLPSLILITGLSAMYVAYGSTAAVVALLYAVKPAIVAIVIAAAWRIGSRSLRHPLLVGLAVLSFIAILLDAPFPAVVLAAACIGWIGVRIHPPAFASPTAHAAEGATLSAAALIDDTTPTPPHARFTWRKVILATVAGIALVGLGLAALAQFERLFNMGWFFTKAALMTFGGAYAVLPYVYQGAVEHFQWLTAAQMIDGLALGETTPGPLIMIVAFVGYLGAGLAGACVAAYFTFVPSFVFILAGGPVVEATRDDARMTAPLTAISAAVVGVIVSLAVFFGQHVFLTPASIDYTAIGIAVLSAVALVRYRLSTAKLISVCAIFGLVLSYWNV
jgi:chromate transporter